MSHTEITLSTKITGRCHINTPEAMEYDTPEETEDTEGTEDTEAASSEEHQTKEGYHTPDSENGENSTQAPDADCTQEPEPEQEQDQEQGEEAPETLRYRSELMLYAVWKRFSWKINQSLTLKGHSRAAEKTCFLIPELGLYLDGALQCHVPPQVMCITHCHSDHSTAIPMILTGADTNPNIYVPKASLHLFENYLQSHYQLSIGTNRVRNRHYQLHGKEPGDVWRENLKGRTYEIQAFKCYHSVPAIGYGLSEVKQKLRADLREKVKLLQPREMGQLRKDLAERGETITEECIEPILTFLCDTTHRVFEDATVFNYPCIMIECTNLYQEHEHYARTNKHVCWTKIRDIVKSHPSNLFVLIHFSMRYSWEEIDEFFEKEQQEHGIDNIYIWRN